MYQDFASRLAQMRQARRGGGSGAAKLESTPVAKEKSVSPTPQGKPNVATLLPSSQPMWGRGGGDLPAADLLPTNAHLWMYEKL